ANGEVRSFVQSGSAMLLFGPFMTLGGAARPGVGAVDIATGAPLGAYPQLDGPVSTLSVAAGSVFVGGAFSSIDGQPVGNLAVFPLTALLEAPPLATGNGSLRLAVAPNPSHGSLAVEFTLSQGATVRARVLDVSGRTVAT